MAASSTRVRRSWQAGAIVLLALGALAIGLWQRGADPDAEPDRDELAAFEDTPPEDWLFGGPDDWDAPDPEDGEGPAADRGSAGRGGSGSPDDADREARRAERWRRRVEIVPLGPSEPSLGPDDVREAFRDARPVVRECIREAGGWRALRPPDSEDGAGSERRRRRTMRFDVGPDGQVVADSLEFDPPLSEGLEPCFRRAFEGVTLPSPGPDGAGVEMRMGGGRRARFRSVDGGVQRWREGREERDRSATPRPEATE